MSPDERLAKVQRIAAVVADSSHPEEFVQDWWPDDEEAAAILFAFQQVRQQPMSVKLLRRVSDAAQGDQKK